ncbi:glycosyltransferase family 4 protein [Pararhodobacter sp. SW119]|uniref:glycosyltransferase family 4 protein n=1 Tax=Pararhodobacter sp. SW119 TaxID=2780075 RepID=UPI001AE027B4|nr:glycosyltransferase family 4 protein [Pararhodobacter sp. SW119]
MSAPATEVAFAVPGTITAYTGGTQYDRRLIEAMRRAGQPVRLLELPAGWPAPDEAETRAALAQFRALPAGIPVIIDGLVFGAMATADVAALGRPLIVMLHHPLGLEAGLREDYARELIDRERANLRHAAQVVVPSAHVAAILTERFSVEPARIRTALPGFEPPAAGEKRQPLTPPLVLSVGLICRRKGHDVLLRALGMIRDLDWQARIVGLVQDRRYQAELEALRKNLHLVDRVAFLGEQTPEALTGLFSTASIFALATRYEGYGMVLSEAQQHGLPVLSCATGAVPETVGDSALLTPPDDPVAFAVALRSLLINATYHSRIVEQSRARAATLPRWEDTASVMLAAIRAACDRKAA